MTSRGAQKKHSACGTLPATLGGRIRRIREAWGWTQGKLAQRLNTDQQIISAWERDKAQPSRAGTALLASFFGLDVQALLSGEGFTVPDLPKDNTAWEEESPKSGMPDSKVWLNLGPEVVRFFLDAIKASKKDYPAMRAIALEAFGRELDRRKAEV